MARDPRSSGEAGFSLIEVVAALGVFGIAAMALMHLTGENIRAVGALEDKTFAGIVADNQLIDAMTAERLPVGLTSGEVIVAEREWTWTRTVSPTTDPGLLRVEVSVRREENGRILSSLVGVKGV